MPSSARNTSVLADPLRAGLEAEGHRYVTWRRPKAKRMMRVPVDPEIQPWVKELVDTLPKRTRMTINRLVHDVGAHANLEGRILLRASELSYYEGFVDRSAKEASEALTWLPPEDTYYRGLALYDLGWIALDANQWDEARHYLEEAQRGAHEGKHWGLHLILMSVEAALKSLCGNLSLVEALYGAAAEASGSHPNRQSGGGFQILRGQPHRHVPHRPRTWVERE